MMDGYQFRLYPTKEQEQTLLRWIGCQRLIYNAKVSEDRYFRAFKRRFLAVVGEPIPMDQAYSHFKTERTSFLNEVPSQVLRNGAVLWKQASTRHFQGLGGRPKFQKRSGEQSVWLTSELFSFAPQVDRETGEILRYNLQVGTDKFSVGEMDYVSHRPHHIPASIHISIHAGKWFLSFSAKDDTVTAPDNGRDREALTEAVAQELRQLPAETLTARTCGADRGVAKPLVASDGQVYDLLPVQKERIEKGRGQKKTWQRRAARRKKGSKNQKKAYRKAARCQQYEANVRKEYAHQTSHALAADERYTLYAFEDLKIQHMTRRPKAKLDESRGVTKILSGVPLTKAKKTVRMRKTVGPERSEPVQSAQKPEETNIRRDADDPCVAHKSMSQETPAAMPETPTTARSARRREVHSRRITDQGLHVRRGGRPPLEQIPPRLDKIVRRQSLGDILQRPGKLSEQAPLRTASTR